MSSDGHVAAALYAFAKEIRRKADPGRTRPATQRNGEFRQQNLEQLAAQAEGLAANPRKATYQGFERILKQAEELGAPAERDIVIAVASAFMQRPYVPERRFHSSNDAKSPERG
ncbi:MAG: hypothetical protein JO137_03100 [Hyphomicrobiales bacterium]|nr:hypothetical protein [Hyphomicrobiales bacterium]MBV9430788.1 hypothetical protein [Hyphomicrobiales bacterium]